MDGKITNLRTKATLRLVGLLPTLRRKDGPWYIATAHRSGQEEAYDFVLSAEHRDDLWKVDVWNWFTDLSDAGLTTLHMYAILKEAEETSAGWLSLLIYGVTDNLEIVQLISDQKGETDASTDSSST